MKHPNYIYQCKLVISNNFNASTFTVSIVKQTVTPYDSQEKSQM